MTTMLNDKRFAMLNSATHGERCQVRERVYGVCKNWFSFRKMLWMRRDIPELKRLHIARRCLNISAVKHGDKHHVLTVYFLESEYAIWIVVRVFEEIPRFVKDVL
ncbi:hypothetical protein F8A86_00300 [Betaproteobacteria bacterium SCN1]|nr:hypothetical protein F8A86_00300 [Betaproteobacteria bacterium SCN1]